MRSPLRLANRKAAREGCLFHSKPRFGLVAYELFARCLAAIVVGNAHMRRIPVGRIALRKVVLRLNATPCRLTLRGSNAADEHLIAPVTGNTLLGLADVGAVLVVTAPFVLPIHPVLVIR